MQSWQEIGQEICLIPTTAYEIIFPIKFFHFWSEEREIFISETR